MPCMSEKSCAWELTRVRHTKSPYRSGTSERPGLHMGIVFGTPSSSSMGHGRQFAYELPDP
eukprot:8348151-Karenia_brevis.AAC.1